MTIDKLTLNSIIKIRRHQPPKVIHSLIDSFGVDVLRYLFKELNIESARACLFSKNGNSLEYRKIIGDQSHWKSFSDKRIKKGEFANGSYRFSLVITDENNRKVKFLVGYILVYRNTKLISNEYESIYTVLGFIGDYLKTVIQTDRLTRTIQLYTVIANEIVSEKLPGSILSRSQNSIHRLLSASVSCFCIYNDGFLYEEYLKNRNLSNALHIRTKGIECDSNLKKIIENYTFFNQHIDRKSQIYKLYQKWNKGREGNINVFISVIKNDEKPIAIWFLFFNDNIIQFTRDINDLLSFVNKQIGINYNYLFQRSVNKMVVDPLFKGRDTRVEMEKVFILMPFTLEWSNRIWQKIIKPTIDEMELNAFRADDLYGHDIMEDIWNSIVKSRIIVADITDRNSNVFYELGIAHTLGKDVILITQKTDDIPFDLNRYRHIVYKDNVDGCETLRKGLQNTIKEILSNH
jgi:hypothetical protein